MRPVRVLFATRAYESRPVEGGFVFLRDLARGMRDISDVRPWFLSTRHGDREGEIGLVGGLRAAEWTFGSRISFVRGLAAYHAHFDVIHTAHAPTGLNAPFFRLLRSVGRASDTRFVQTITALPRGRSLPGGLLCWGDRTVCQTREHRDRLGDLDDPVRCITPWPAPDRVALDRERRNETRRRRFSRYDRIVVFPGEFRRLGLDVGFRECILAMLRHRPDTCVVLACRHDSDGIGSEIHRSLPDGIAQRVFVVGEIPWILRLLEAADLVIYPARTMSGKFQPPLVLLETLTLGVPVLVSAQIALPDSAGSDLTFVEPTRSWRRFGRRARHLLEHRPTGPRPVNRFPETIRAYRRCFVGTEP